MTSIPIYRKTGYPVGTWREARSGHVTITYNGVVVTRRRFWDARMAHRHLQIRGYVFTQPAPAPDRFAHLVAV